jgi:hypothetical protein
MNRSAENVYALLVEANPVSDVENLPVSDRPHLYVVDTRRDDMQTEERVEAIGQDLRRRRGWIPALVAGLVTAVAVSIVIIATGGGDSDPVAGGSSAAPIPDFSADVALVGQAVMAAENAYDPDLFLGLFSADAELRFGSDVFSPDEVRSGAEMTGSASHFKYDQGWARTTNEQQTYSSCTANGDRVLCDLDITSDVLEGLMPPVPHTAAFQIRDGKIVLFVVASVSSSDDQIREDYHRWTFENYPEEAALMWEAEWQADEVATVESAELHLRLGDEYVRLHG